MLIIGAARQGIALAKYLANQGVHVTLNDQRSADALEEVRTALAELPVKLEAGGHPLSLLKDVDTVFPSGGIPLDIPILVEAAKQQIPLSNDSQVFLETTEAKVIGITGSAGKTTTTSLVGKMAEAAINAHSQLGYGKVWVGGNIGFPLIEQVDEIQADDLVVMELSSFQLELMTRSPQVAVLLNLTPNHLDRHGTMDAYSGAKAHILEFQSEADVSVLGRDDANTWAMAERVAGQLYSFGIDELPEGELGTYVNDGSIWLRNQDGDTEVMPIEEIKLRGEHNLQNVLAACAIAAAVGLPVQAMRSAAEEFAGVEHRLEFIREWGAAEWYNDSIATAPERSIAAMRSFDEPIMLLAGGKDKDLPWEKFAEVVNQRVAHLIVFGEVAQTILDAVGQSDRLTITRCEGLADATRKAAEIVKPGIVVLLSPGGTSYDEFFDFEERGNKFKEWVRAL